MGRQSGFWAFLFSLAITVSAISATLIETAPRPAARGTLRELDAGFRKTSSNPLDFNHQVVDHFLLPANAIVIVGSLDVSGSPHQIDLESDLLSASTGLSEIPSEPHASRSNDSPDSSSVRYLQLSSAESKTSAERSILSSSPHMIDSAVKATRVLNSDSITEPVANRVFLIPHFLDQSIVDQPTETRCLASSERIAVYVDEALMTGSLHGKSSLSSSPACHLQQLSEDICQTIAIPMAVVEHWIGPIADLDGDGRVAVVITDLDRRANQGESPILGCVRNRDFETDTDADFAGDIVYLDHRIPSGKDRNALLAHELTHAAIATLPREISRSIPPWLNEAAAHWVEFHFSDAPIGFNRRVDRFHSNTAGCPIVANELHVTHAARQSGCRASAAGFLKACLRRPEQLQSLLSNSRDLSESISAATNERFGDLFRRWSVDQAQLIAYSTQNDGLQSIQPNLNRKLQLLGTSFVVMKTGENAGTLTITSNAAAKIQITVLAPQTTLVRN